MLTHWLNNYNEDPVNARIHSLGFDKGQHRVHVIYVPSYLNGTDGIFNLSYYQLLPGADATVFASYYEPWGYTPLESIAFGVPTVTTCLSGFGQWAEQNRPGGLKESGVEVIDRNDSNYGDTVRDIAAAIAFLATAPASLSNDISAAASATSALALWANFYKYYDIAYVIAAEKAAARSNKK